MGGKIILHNASKLVHIDIKLASTIMIKREECICNAYLIL